MQEIPFLEAIMSKTFLFLKPSLLITFEQNQFDFLAEPTTCQRFAI